MKTPDGKLAREIFEKQYDRRISEVKGSSVHAAPFPLLEGDSCRIFRAANASSIKIAAIWL